MMTEFRDTPQMIIMADDDPEDCLLTQEAWEESGNTQQIRFVHDGEELLDYLHHRGKFASAQDNPLPSMILLDLHMPKRNGHEVLRELRSQKGLRHIPVVMFTDSIDAEETCQTYALGANACMTKPRTTQDYQKVIGSLSEYWSSMVILPSTPEGGDFYHPTRTWM